MSREGLAPAPVHPPGSRRHFVWILIATGFLLVVTAALIGAGVIRIGRGPTQLTGAVVDPPFAAPNFELNDQFDRPVSLASFKGKVVALTFLYTQCPDACPLITEKLHQAYGQLGPDASRISIIAITVDPEHDTTAQVRSYSVQKDMLDKWHFLVGPSAKIRPVLAAYGIDAIGLDDQAARTQATAVALNLSTPTALPRKGFVDHSSPTFLIDRTGRARAILDVDFSPTDLIQNVKALLDE